MSITPNMVPGGDCGCTGNPLNVPLVTPDNPNGRCYTPCPHTHPLDGDTSNPWRVIILDTAAFTNKYLYFNGSQIVPMAGGGGSGTVTSVAASISGALSVAGSPITTNGTLAFAWTGTSSQYVLGDGTLATKITNNNQLINGEGFITLSSLSALSPIMYNNGTGAISTSMATNKLIGRGTAGTGVMEEITLGTGLSFSGTTLNVSGFVTSAITSLNGLTAATQIFTNDTNVTITSAVSTHTIGWSGTLSGTRGGTGVNNGSNTITIAGNLITTGAFNTTFAQQITGIFTLPPVAGTIAASTSTLTSGRMVFTATSGMLIDSANLTWDDTNKRLFGANDITFGKSTSYNISFAGTTTTITSSNNIQINCALTGNGIKLFSTDYDLFKSTRTFINNHTALSTLGSLGGSLTTRQSDDFSFTSGEATYTAGGGTTITAATGSWNVLGATKTIGVGDRVSLSNASSTYATVTSVTSNTVFTVDTAIGAAGTLTLNVKPANFRVFSNANALQFIVNDLGYVGIGITVPTAYLHLAPSTNAVASLLIPSGTAPAFPIDGQIWFDGTNIKMRIGGVTKTFTLT